MYFVHPFNDRFVGLSPVIHLEVIQKDGEATFLHGRIFEVLTKAQEGIERRQRRF